MREQPNTWSIFAMILIVLIIGIIIGFFTHPLIQTTINIAAGNYTMDIGPNMLAATLNQTRITEYSSYPDAICHYYACGQPNATIIGGICYSCENVKNVGCKTIITT